MFIFFEVLKSGFKIRVLFYLISYNYFLAILRFCCFKIDFWTHSLSWYICILLLLIKGCSLRLTRPKSSSLRLSFQFILLEIVSNNDFINID